MPYAELYFENYAKFNKNLKYFFNKIVLFTSNVCKNCAII